MASKPSIAKGPGFEILGESWTTFDVGGIEIGIRATLLHAKNVGEQGELQAGQQVVCYAPSAKRGLPRVPTKVEEAFDNPTPASVGISRYKLENGAIIEIATDVVRLMRMDGFNEAGMPIFNLQTGQRISTQPPGK